MYSFQRLILLVLLSIGAVASMPAYAATQQQAMAECQAYIGGYPGYACVHAPTTGGCVSTVSSPAIMSTYNGVYDYGGCWHFTPECPAGSSWDLATNACSAPCSERPSLSGGQWVPYDYGLLTSPTTVCSDGCAFIFDTSTGTQYTTSIIDGTTWSKVDGFVPTGATCSAGPSSPQPDSNGPPVDADGDGVSDGNDASPNDPGESVPPIPPPDPSTCGGAGQPPCPSTESDPNRSTGGGDCRTPPQSSGDAILGQIAYQTWATRCAIANGAGDGSINGPKDGHGAVVTGSPEVCNTAYTCTGDSAQCAQVALLRKTACSDVISGNVDSDGDGFGVDDKTNLQAIKDAVTADGDGGVGAGPEVPWVSPEYSEGNWSSGLGGGTCPAPISRTITLGSYSQAIEFSFGPMCEFSGYIFGIIVAISSVIGAMIFSGVRK